MAPKANSVGTTTSTKPAKKGLPPKSNSAGTTPAAAKNGFKDKENGTTTKSDVADATAKTDATTKTVASANTSDPNLSNPNLSNHTADTNGTPTPPTPPLEVKSILKRTVKANPKTHNKHIVFHNKKKTKRIPNLSSMPEDVLQDIWWGADDYDDMMRSFEYTVFMMEAGEQKVVDDDVEHCTRGLELRTEAGKWSRFEHKRDCYNAVLDEQDRQWNAGEDNQDKIANSCREVTAKTQRIACRKGMQDEKDIAEFVADVRSIIVKQGLSPPPNNDDNNSKSSKSSRLNGEKSLPSRTKSASTGQLKRRTPRTDSGKARTVEKSPPRKPERVLSGKSERGAITPTNSGIKNNNDSSSNDSKTGAPRTPKRTVTPKSSGGSGSVGASGSAALPRIPPRQTFSNNSSTGSGNSDGGTASNNPRPTKRLPKRSFSTGSTGSNKSTGSNGSSGSAKSTGSASSLRSSTSAIPKSPKTTAAAKAAKAASNLFSNPRIPKRTASNTSSNMGDDDDDLSESKGHSSFGALANFFIG